MGSLVVLLLAERARSECARPTRAFEDQPGHPLKRVTSKLGGERGRSGLSLVLAARAQKTNLIVRSRAVLGQCAQ
jgi:hypothetical protein